MRSIVAIFYLTALINGVEGDSNRHHESQRIGSTPVQLDLPYAARGWTREAAAVHLLNRFAYGHRPGQVPEVAQDPAAWLADQIQAALPDKEFERALTAKYPAQTMSLEEVGQTYPAPGVRIIFASLYRAQNGLSRSEPTAGNRIRQRRKNETTMASGGRTGADSTRQNGQNALLQRIINAEEKTDERYRRFQQVAERRFGWLDFSELFYQLMAQKLERAVYSPNQLEEIMVDFWLNHFNVSIHGVNDEASQVFSYERDAIRPYALGNFRDLLGATAHHPAMLLYLDNHRSNAAENRQTLMEPIARMMAFQEKQKQQNESLRQFAQQPGVNENYARELLELHTLGVDGGYSQRDIEEVARAFTGWKASPFIYPMPEDRQTLIRQWIEAAPHAVLTEGFLFDPFRHDAEAKTILGEEFPAGNGVEEGEKILDKLAAHPSTAHHVSKKIATRFVSDDPPTALVEAMTDTFLQTKGDIRAVLTTMVTAEAFWDKSYQAAKIKTPLELIASSLRATDTQVDDYRGLIRWCTRMGQPLYAYQSPVGYPEVAEFWTNGSALLNRMNYANELAFGEIVGTNVNLLALNGGHEPESEQEAQSLYLKKLIPGRDTRETYELLWPVLADPTFSQKLEARVNSDVGDSERSTDIMDAAKSVDNGLPPVVGLIIGSPEFQRQ